MFNSWIPSENYITHDSAAISPPIKEVWQAKHAKRTLFPILSNYLFCINIKYIDSLYIITIF